MFQSSRWEIGLAYLMKVEARRSNDRFDIDNLKNGYVVTALLKPAA
jgi:hypothetical protein